MHCESETLPTIKAWNTFLNKKMVNLNFIQNHHVVAVVFIWNWWNEIDISGFSQRTNIKSLKGEVQLFYLSRLSEPVIILKCTQTCYDNRSKTSDKCPALGQVLRHLIPFLASEWTVFEVITSNPSWNWRSVEWHFIHSLHISNYMILFSIIMLSILMNHYIFKH